MKAVFNYDDNNKKCFLSTKSSCDTEDRSNNIWKDLKILNDNIYKIIKI